MQPAQHPAMDDHVSPLVPIMTTTHPNDSSGKLCGLVIKGDAKRTCLACELQKGQKYACHSIYEFLLQRRTHHRPMAERFNRHLFILCLPDL
jgi:hypothetical protein